MSLYSLQPPIAAPSPFCDLIRYAVSLPRSRIRGVAARGAPWQRIVPRVVQRVRSSLDGPSRRRRHGPSRHPRRPDVDAPGIGKRESRCPCSVCADNAHDRQEITNSPAGSGPTSSRSATWTARPSPPAPRSAWRPCRSTSKRNRWPARAIGPSVHLRFTATSAQDNIVLTVAYGGAFDGKAWFSGVSVDEAPGAEPWPAPAAVTTIWPRLSLPGRRMDLSSHRRPALRARLSARASDGQRDRAIHGALRRRTGSQGQEQELGSGAHHGHRALHARFRSGDSRRNERHRRRCL